MAVQDSTEAAQTGEAEGTDGSDKPPHGDNSKHRLSIKNLTAHNNAASKVKNVTHTSSAPKPLLVPEKKPTVAATNGIQTANSSSSAHHSIPIPPPDAFSHDKQPGLTRETLKQLQLHQKQESTSTPSSASPTTLSPTVSESEGWSVPSSRAPSRPGSRAPSFSSVKAGVNVDIPSATPTPKKEGKPIAAPVVSKTPSRAASVASDGGEKKSISIKEFLSGAGPKLARRSSQRSNASSRKSDSDGRSVGESTASLLKKYGVCERVAIGKGATSVVRLAHKWDRSEEKLYAVKEFRKRRKNETEKEYVKKLTAEFCISSTLHHVNIVETVDLVQDENQRWCEVMEFCPGGDLYAAIKRGGMSPSEVECCFRQILTGVAYLHSQGVAHRDIKPENLFFDTKGHLKIGDYGASTVYRLPWETSIHMSTGLCGSEPYIAPEQFMGKPYDARLVDIWACGIVYYCLHFQELPWPSAQLSNPLYAAYASACASPNAAQSACPPTINNLSPRACRPVIRKMLEPEPKLRSSIEDIIAHSWVQSIDVCHTMAKPTHVHVYAQQQAQAQVQMLSS